MYLIETTKAPLAVFGRPNHVEFPDTPSWERQGEACKHGAAQVSTLLLTPICPHTCEHVWSGLLGKAGSVLVAGWPSTPEPNFSLQRAAQYLEEQIPALRKTIQKAETPGKPQKGAPPSPPPAKVLRHDSTSLDARWRPCGVHGALVVLLINRAAPLGLRSCASCDPVGLHICALGQAALRCGAGLFLNPDIRLAKGHCYSRPGFKSWMFHRVCAHRFLSADGVVLSV